MLRLELLGMGLELTVPEAIVVTHAGVIRALLARWRDIPPAEWPQLAFAYGSLTTVEIPG